MSIVPPALAVGFAAFCVWLGVRIINRKERWAKWMLAAVLATAFVCYPLSVGPAEGLRQRGIIAGETLEMLREFYGPISWIYFNGPDSTRGAIDWYFQLWGN